ncbi:MauE/DoxX family redox-associated membrane protein [Streptomyces sp. NPDC101112]|uniref:MauE/DoxX family redox-associated membrane protein n=1 Tax=Streptomyces sp. NPDC101112 TaxID=3366105 RepID=UPI003817FBC1
MHATEAFGRMCLIAVFAWSGVMKFRGRGEFRQHMLRTFALPSWCTDALVVAVPAVELCVAALLLLRRPGWSGPVAALVLLSAFTVYLVRLMRLRPDASCGCAGADGAPVSGVHVVRNLILLALCLTTWWVSSQPTAPSMVNQAVFAVPAAVTGIALLYLAELASFFRTPHTN